MGQLILLYDNAFDSAVLSGGSWTLPLTRMQEPQPSKRARSTNLLPASTKFDVALAAIGTFYAVVVGPGNYSTSMTYRMRAYSDAGYTVLVHDSGVKAGGLPATDSLLLSWSDPNFWLGTQTLVDPDHVGYPIIYVPQFPVTARYWRIEIFDQTNSAGYLDIGRGYMGKTFLPENDYAPEGNQFALKSHTSVQASLSGARYYNRRRAERVFRFAFPVLSQDQVFRDVYTLNLICDLDKQVFVIPDPDDADHILKRAFLGNLSELSGIQLFQVGLASTAFDVTEAI